MQPVCTAVSHKTSHAKRTIASSTLQAGMLQDVCCQTATSMAIFGWYPARFSSLTTCSIAVRVSDSGSARGLSCLRVLDSCEDGEVLSTFHPSSLVPAVVFAKHLHDARACGAPGRSGCGFWLHSRCEACWSTSSPGTLDFQCPMLQLSRESSNR